MASIAYKFVFGGTQTSAMSTYSTPDLNANPVVWTAVTPTSVLASSLGDTLSVCIEGPGTYSSNPNNGWNFSGPILIIVSPGDDATPGQQQYSATGVTAYSVQQNQNGTSSSGNMWIYLLPGSVVNTGYYEVTVGFQVSGLNVTGSPWFSDDPEMEVTGS